MNRFTFAIAALALASASAFAKDGDRKCELKVVDAEHAIEALVCTPVTSTADASTDGTGKEIMIEDASLQGDVGSIGVAL
jgi:hypothetical protein